MDSNGKSELTPDKLRKYVKRVSSQVFLIIILSGVVIILSKELYFGSSGGSFEGVIFAIGSAAISGGVIGFLMNKYVHKLETDLFVDSVLNGFRNSEDVSYFCNILKSLLKHVESDSVIKKCNHDGLNLLSIYVSRGKEREVIKEDIVNSMNESNEIRLLGTTHRDFFKLDGMLIEPFKEFISKNNSVKILIVNPLSPLTVKRTLFEEGEDFELNFKQKPYDNYTTSETFKDINNVLKAYKSQFHETNNIKFRFYMDHPSMWCIILK